MSEWITDRLPTAADADEDNHVWWTSPDGEVMRCYYGDIQIGEVWAPKPKPVPPKPYVKPEPKRWKPQINEFYWTVNNDVLTNSWWEDDSIDRSSFAAFNCFQTREQAIESARRVRETLLNYHKELSNESLYTKPL